MSLVSLKEPVEIAFAVDTLGSRVVWAGIAGRESGLALRSGEKCVHGVLGDLRTNCGHSLGQDVLARVSIPRQDPNVLDVVEAGKAKACVDNGVVVVVGLDDLVVARGDELAKLDFEVAVVLGWVNLKGLADATAPLGRVLLILVVDDTDVAIVLERVLCGVADAIL